MTVHARRHVARDPVRIHNATMFHARHETLRTPDRFKGSVARFNQSARYDGVQLARGIYERVSRIARHEAGLEINGIPTSIDLNTSPYQQTLAPNSSSPWPSQLALRRL
jgi:hypothetical protein